jgi:C4-dicarboxylate-specific signal transduction histidine kinase
MIDQARHERDDVEAAFRIQTPSGVVKHLHVVGHAMHPHPAQRVFVGAIQDVTERRLAEEALDKARAQLDHASRVMSLGVLTASIAHEVNQPLAGILTNASTCVRMLGADPPNLDGALETAHRTIRDAKRAAEIIARLRTLFGKSELAAAPADLNEAAREVIALTRKELQRHRIALHTRLAAALPTVIGDHVQLQQVILNLLLNACDATCAVDDRPREILVETVHEDGAVRLTIRDTGAGISRAARDKLFEPFFTTKPEGMGIGLSISRSIVERHGGKLWAVQDNGPGAAFAFSIPCASASSAT